MNGKREFLKNVIEKAFCYHTTCLGCPYRHICYSDSEKSLKEKLARIGAMAILRMFPEKKKPTLDVGTKIKFSDGSIATIVYFRKEIILFFESHKEKLDYLIGKTWEVVE